MRQEAPDLSGHMNMLCAALGFPDKAVVREIRLTPSEATILYYQLDENGDRHIDVDGRPYSGWVTMKVTT